MSDWNDFDKAALRWRKLVCDPPAPTARRVENERYSLWPFVLSFAAVTALVILFA